MRNGLLLAYKTDLQYIQGRLALIQYLKERKHPEAAGQVTSDLHHHIGHNVDGLNRLLLESEGEPT